MNNRKLHNNPAKSFDVSRIVKKKKSNQRAQQSTISEGGDTFASPHLVVKAPVIF